MSSPDQAPNREDLSANPVLLGEQGAILGEKLGTEADLQFLIGALPTARDRLAARMAELRQRNVESETGGIL